MGKIKKRLISSFLLFMLVCMMPINVSAAAKFGTAKVWAGVPLIGHVYVCTPYSVKYTGVNSVKKITSITTGESYTSAGVALITYEHYDSWGTKVNNTNYEIRARGHCDFVFKGCPISLGLQTFLYSDSI